MTPNAEEHRATLSNAPASQSHSSWLEQRSQISRDQKVGGSSPSQRARSQAPCPPGGGLSANGFANSGVVTAGDCPGEDVCGFGDLIPDYVRVDPQRDRRIGMAQPGRDDMHRYPGEQQGRRVSCLFCDIINGREESSPAYDDEHVVAFMDIQPVTPGHLLVVPRAHADFLETLDEGLGAHLFRVAHRLARALYRSGLPCEGVNLFLADGAAAFQEVFHVHLHVFPRTAGDGFRIDADWRRRDRAELDGAAEQVRRGLRAL